MDRMKLYDIIYALAARDGREATLFGSCASTAREAFSRSLAGEAFPEIWFEIPLAGGSWFDLHSLVSHEDVAGTQPAFSGQGGVYADALAWFGRQQRNTVRQLALSYDTHVGDVDSPAVQLLVNGCDISVPFGFLEAVGRSDAKEAYRAFFGSMPEEWYACYVGTFPSRQAEEGSSWVRVECLVRQALQQAYAGDVATLRDHLARVGMTWLGDDDLGAVQRLACSPFPLEFQFDVGAQGEALPTLSASVRFAPEDWVNPDRVGCIRDLLREVQDLGLADGRVGQLAGTVFAKRVTYGGESALLSCFPAFIKLRWRASEPTCAKAYLLARAE